jgi:enoyl-CoA hydratase/carnithine racemase
MSDQEVIVEHLASVTVISINRPERRNALNLRVKEKVAAAFEEATGREQTRVIVLTGAGGYFVAGTDVAEMATMTPADHHTLRTGEVFAVIRACPKIVIAAVEGYALGGGCELALCCDMILAGRSAKFGQPEIRVGIMPGAGGTQRLVRVMGRYRAMKLVLTGDAVGAEEAFALGMISEVVPDGAARAQALALAARVVEMPPVAVHAIKQVINLGQDVPLETALALERQAFVSLFGGEDQREGMRAFLEKRAPVYTGR